MKKKKTQKTKALFKGEREPENILQGLYVPIVKKESDENQNRTTVSNYLTLQMAASCRPCEAGRPMHSHTQKVNQAALWLSDQVYIIWNLTVVRCCKMPSGMTGKNTGVMAATIKLLSMKR